MKKISIWSMILCSLLFITGCGKDDCKNCDEEKESGNIQVGDALPEFSVKLKNGEVMNKTSLEGKISLVLFFSITCPDCQALFPSIERIYNEYKDNDKFVLLAISRSEGEDKVGPFMNEKGYTFPYSPQETRDVYSLFAPSIVPRVYISNDECIVEEVFIDNPLATYEDLKKILDELIEYLCCKA